jgi:hypothetical protein
LELCGVAHRRFAFAPMKRRAQAGFCDVGCDLPFDGSVVDGCFSAADAASFCDCGGCDGSGGRKKGRQEEQYVYIPPNSMRP